MAVPAAPTTLGSSAASLERPHRDRLRWGIVLGGLVVGIVAAVAFVKLHTGEPQIATVSASSTTPVLAPDAAVPDAPTAPALAATPPPDAAPTATPPADAAAPATAAAPPPVLPPVRKVTRPKPRSQAGSDDDVGGSRL
jgi:hypothetical protein